jgi:hypothetical protein
MLFQRGVWIAMEIAPLKKGRIEAGFLEAVGDKLPEKIIVEQSGHLQLQSNP